MTRGHEVGSLLLVANPVNAVERTLASHCRGVAAWFNALWGTATNLGSIKADYEGRHAENSAKAPTLTDDDTADEKADRRGALSPSQLVSLRAATHLWIEAGKLSANRGLEPGDQLMMKRNTRVFFNRQAEDLPENTHLGYVAVRFGKGPRPAPSAPLRFSHNSMDVLTLPVPDAGGPESYDNETLLFKRRVDSRGTWFDLSLGSGSEISKWKKKSTTNGTLFRMSSSRAFGVF
jgi:hypothetical protein